MEFQNKPKKSYQLGKKKKTIKMLCKKKNYKKGDSVQRWFQKIKHLTDKNSGNWWEGGKHKDIKNTNDEGGCNSLNKQIIAEKKESLKEKFTLGFAFGGGNKGGGVSRWC